MLWPPEGRFAVDHPVMPEQLAEPSGEDLRLSELIQIAIEAELSFATGALQGSHELTAKNPAQYLDGKKERVAGMDPGQVVLLILVVKFFESALAMNLKTLSDLLIISISILLIAAALHLSHKHSSEQ